MKTEGNPLNLNRFEAIKSSSAGKFEVENIIILFPWSETNALWHRRRTSLVLAELNCNRLLFMLISYNIYQTAKD